MQSLRAPALALLGLVAFLLLWEAMPYFGLVNPAFLPGPSALPKAFMRELSSGAWFAAILGSLWHYFVGLFVGAGLGIAFGVLIGMSRIAEETKGAKNSAGARISCFMSASLAGASFKGRRHYCRCPFRRRMI